MIEKAMVGNHRLLYLSVDRAVRWYDTSRFTPWAFLEADCAARSCAACHAPRGSCISSHTIPRADYPDCLLCTRNAGSCASHRQGTRHREGSVRTHKGIPSCPWRPPNSEARTRRGDRMSRPAGPPMTLGNMRDLGVQAACDSRGTRPARSNGMPRGGIGLKRRRADAVLVEPSHSAARNKCLAGSNKSRTVAYATKKRNLAFRSHGLLQ
jgi:hypothetical protein